LLVPKIGSEVDGSLRLSMPFKLDGGSAIPETIEEAAAWGS
jgi:hypothetical protein